MEYWRGVRREVGRGIQEVCNVCWIGVDWPLQWRWTWLEFDVRYAVGKFVGGGVRTLGRGVRKKGGSDEPPEPPGYGPELGETKLCAAIVEAGWNTSHPKNHTGDITDQTPTPHRSHPSTVQGAGVVCRVLDEGIHSAQWNSVRWHQRQLHHPCPHHDVTPCAPMSGEKEHVRAHLANLLQQSIWSYWSQHPPRQT